MLCNMLKLFRKSEEGGVIIIVTFSILVLFIAAGIAFDMARTQMAKVKLASCLDTAGVAALAKVAEVPQNTTVNNWVVQNVKKYFLADCQSGYLETAAVSFNGQKTINNVSISLSPDLGTLTLDAIVMEKTMLMPVIGVTTVAVPAHTVVTRQTAGMELVLVLDNTGSMGDSVLGGPGRTGNPAKIDALKCALYGDGAKSPGFCLSNNLVTFGLLNILYGSTTSRPNLFVGLISYGDMVNVGGSKPSSPGSTIATANYPQPSLSSHRTLSGTSDCIDSRDGTKKSIEDSDISPQDGMDLTMDISEDPPSKVVPGAEFMKMPASFTDSSTAPVNTYCPHAFHQLTANLTDVVSEIKKMTPNGNTEIQLGFAWGWRLLSPKWQGKWGTLPTYTPIGGGATLPLPLQYNTAGMQKVVVLMTDGVNTVPTHLNDLGQMDTLDSNPKSPDYADSYINNAYEFQFGYYPSGSVRHSKLDDRTYAVCDAMKKRGIIIYTIGFGPASGPDGVNATLLKHCATADTSPTSPHFFLAPTNDQLAKAFVEIGNQLSNLLITQ